jgi:hypothetical protein
MKTQLINGWEHPLSEHSELEGRAVVNVWGFASQLVGVATGRCEGYREKAVEALADLGIEDFGNCEDDGDYLKLLNRCSFALERKLDEQFGS